MATVKYNLMNIADILFTYCEPAGIVLYNLITPNNTNGFKLAFGGVVFGVLLVIVAIRMFKHSYDNKYKILMEQLAVETDDAVKAQLKAEIDKQKIYINAIDRINACSPFIVLTLVCFLGNTTLSSIAGTSGLITVGLLTGSVFNVWKKQYQGEAKTEKIRKKLSKKNNTNTNNE